MISDQSLLIRNNSISNIKGFNSKDENRTEYDIDIVNECLDNHRKCTGEYTNHELNISFICYCKCHKKNISIDEIIERLNSNICPECGNDHSFNGYTNIKKKTSFDTFQKIIDNDTKKQAIKNEDLLEVIA